MFEKPEDMKIAKSAGSPAFMPPELCTIRSGRVDGKPADIWSMGVTLFCLRFGHVPFEAGAVLDLFDAITKEDLKFDDGIGVDLIDLFKRILEKDPVKRIKMEELRVHVAHNAAGGSLLIVLQEHPWVTRRGEDPLLPAAENCSLISPPTDEELDTAITSNVNGVMAVVGASQFHEVQPA